MDFLEKAKIRMEHWIGHNGQHQEEYALFSQDLEKAGMKNSAGYIREMIDLTAKIGDCLRNAVKALEQEKGE